MTGSGSGAASTTDATLLGERHADIGNTPGQYWCFTGDTYAHIVVESATGVFLHFGFGILDKFNDWTGGEYCYGDKFKAASSFVAVQAESTHLLDGHTTGTTPAMQNFVATVHSESLTDSPAGAKWSIVAGNQNTLGNDRQTSPIARTQFLGGFRAGTHTMPFGQFAGTINLGLVPSYPVVVYHWDRDVSTTSLQPQSIAAMGSMKDLRGIMMKNFTARQEVVIGSDTWVLFPTNNLYSGTLSGTSGYQGIMYKQST